MKQHSKLQPQEQAQTAARQQQAQQPAVREFATVEEMLRTDAAQTTVPPTVAERLNQSAASLPQPQPSIWRRLFGH